MHGLIVVDKPPGLTSAHAVEQVRRALHVERAGHGGTLDPIATGVLPICLGAATKLAQYLLADDKGYLATCTLGIETDTLDRTGKVVAEHPFAAVTREALLAALAARTGEQQQIPPMYSAIKQGGIRLYDRARAGEHVERAPRTIRIDTLELLTFTPPTFTISIACTKGTYVRSLVADLGKDVGCGANLAELRRTRTGKLTLADAVPLDRLADARLIPPHEITDLPCVTVLPEHVQKVFDGVQLPPADFGAAAHERFQLLGPSGALLALAHQQDGKTIFDRVFPELHGGR